MTSLTIDMPEQLAAQVQAAGLLEREKVVAIFGDALRRSRASRLFDVIRRNQISGPELIDPENIQAEIERARQAHRA
jgi:hypothetical protein